MIKDELRKEYEALAEDLTDKGHSGGEIAYIIELKESIKNIVDNLQYRHHVPIKCRWEWVDFLSKKSDQEVSSFYHKVGFDRNYKVVLDYCLVDREYQWCLVGSERFDKEWVESGNATDELVDVIKDINNPLRRSAGQSMNDRSRLKFRK